MIIVRLVNAALRRLGVRRGDGGKSYEPWQSEWWHNTPVKP